MLKNASEFEAFFSYFFDFVFANGFCAIAFSISALETCV